MSNTQRRHTHGHDHPSPSHADPAHDAPPRPRERRGGRHGGDHVEPQHGGSGFHDAFAHGHGHGSIIGATVGHARIQGGPLGTTDRVLTAQREVSPAAGFPDRAAATAFAAAHPGSLLAIVRLPDNTFHVYDTGYTPPRPAGAPGSARTEPRVQVSAISRSGMYELVDWANLDVRPHDPLPDGVPEPTMRGTGPDRFSQFAAANRSLGDARLTQIRLALEQVVGSDVELREAFYDNYTRHNLTVASDGAARDMRRRDWEASTSEAGNTALLPEVLDYPAVRLVSLLLHEMMHGRRNHPGSNPVTGNPVQEGEAYAVQYFTVERANGPQAERNRILQIVTTGGGEVLGQLVPQLVASFNRTYVAMVVLQQLIDARFTHTDAPFHRMSSVRAGELMFQLATDATHSRELRAVIDWADENRSRFPLPRRG